MLQVVTADAVFLRCPVPPAVRSLDDGLVRLPGNCGLLFVDVLQVIKEFEEHHPRQHRQTINVAAQPLVLPHDVTGGFDEASELLGGGERLFGLFRFGRHSYISETLE